MGSWWDHKTNGTVCIGAMGDCFQAQPFKLLECNRQTMYVSNPADFGKEAFAETPSLLMSLIKSNPHAPVAQLDRAPDFESVGRRFESCRARQS
jgi:hypothetical protein